MSTNRHGWPEPGNSLTFRAPWEPFFRVAVFATLVLSALMSGRSVQGQAAPILQLRPDGPLASIHRLQFSADGSSLYAAGEEKLVQVWRLNQGRFERVHSESLRHSIGPGPLGSLHAMSVSRDGRYVVAGGIGTFNQQAGFSADGIMIPSLAWSSETLDAVGKMSVFDLRFGTLKEIKTHAGYVLAAEVVTFPDPMGSLLITIGNDETVADCGSAPQSGPEVARSVRVFRIRDGQRLAKWSIPETRIAPTLTAWTAPQARDETGLRVAVTLANGAATDELVLLRPGANPTRFSLPFCLAVDQIHRTGQLCVSARQSIHVMRDGRLEKIDLSDQMSEREVIYSLAMIESRPSLAVVTTREIRDLRRETPSRHRLRLVDLVTAKFLLGKGIPIGNRQNPVIAVDPRGRYIAATADVTKGVQIFEIRPQGAKSRQWPQNQYTKTLQILEPDFQPIRRAALVTINGKKILRLEIESDDATHRYDLIDGALRRVEAVANSFDTALSFAPNDRDRREYLASVPLNGSVGQINVKSTRVPIGKRIDCKVLNGRPLVAVAFLQYSGESQAILALYDPATGRELRRLSGHQQVVTGIEFSEDHEYLTSVSADGMVCVWSLRDLNRVVGRRGAIHDVRWCSDQGTLTVSSVSGPVEAAGLQPGDRVVGVFDDINDELFEYELPEDFFRGVSQYRPSSKARIRVSRKGREMDVLVTLGQVADERKPLFSFISRSDPKSGQLEWLAWAPSGPFQSSGAGIEQRAGWHFNPKGDGKPARFAPFSQYRDQFSGDGLLRELLALGRIPDVWPPLARAELSARFVDENGATVRPVGYTFQIDAPLSQMRVAVSGVPARFVSSVTGDVDGDVDLQFARSEYDSDFWVCDLPNALREQHVVTVVISSSRVRDGAQRESWIVIPPPVAVAASVPPVRIMSHQARTEVRKANLDNAQRIFLEAIVGDDEIPKEFEFSARRNGVEVKLSDVGIQGNRVSGWVPGVLGTNRVALTLKHRSKISVSPVIEIQVIDPPFIESIRASSDNKNHGRIELEIRSSLIPTKRDFRVFLGNLAVDGWSFKAVPTISGFYRVTVSGLTLSEGPNRFNIQLVNITGRIWQREDVTLTGVPQPLQPKLELVLKDESKSSEIEVMAVVISRDLKEIQVQVGDHRIQIDIPENGGSAKHLIPMRLPIEYGPNHITVSAVSEAGLVAFESRVVTRIEPPVEFVVERIQVAGHAAIGLRRQQHGVYTALSSLPKANVNVEGYVRISDSSAAPEDGAMWVRGWVNGFLQSVVPLNSTANTREFSFSIPMLLASEENEIRLDLPGIVEPESSPLKVTAKCDHPSYDQTLYLLVISRRVPGTRVEREKYEQRVLELLGVVNGSMPAFNHVISGSDDHWVQTGHVNSDVVQPMLRDVRDALRKEQASNNTVLLYFQGEEFRSAEGGICLMTSDATPERAFTDKTLITSKFLGKMLGELRCANLLFLDVTQHPKSAQVKFAGDPRQPGLGVLRLVDATPRKQVSSPQLMEQVRRVIPNVGELGELAEKLRTEVALQASGLAVSESIPPFLLRMRFGESFIRREPLIDR